MIWTCAASIFLLGSTIEESREPTIYYYNGRTYYDDEYWYGPGWYYGRWFGSKEAYWIWRRRHPYWWWRLQKQKELDAKQKK